MSRRSIILASNSMSGSSKGNTTPQEKVNMSQPLSVPAPPCLLEIQSKSYDEDENDSLVSSVSSLSNTSEDGSCESPKLSSPRSITPRSIFGSYWKVEGEAPARQLCPPRTRSPMSVMVDPYSYQHPYSPTMELLLLEQALGEENDVDSMNTYERTLKDCEVVPDWRKRQSFVSPYVNAPLWMSWFTKNNASAPSLRTNGLLLRTGGTLSQTRQVQSDSALHTIPLRSALRQGRFSQNKPATNSHHVHFQPQIQVCSYQPPVESWAEEGWSQWFGS